MPVTHTSGLPLTNTLAPSVPASVSVNGRYVLDQYSQPYLMLADQILPCLQNVALSDVYTVLADRQSRGYNAMWICLIPDAGVGGSDTLADFNGNAPFNGSGFSSPNSAYWTRVDQLVATAASYGLTCVLTPVDTSGHGFFSLARTAGSGGCQSYGQFLGARYGASPNIVWLHGNDFGASASWVNGQPGNVTGGYQSGDNTLCYAIQTGISSTSDAHLVTNELNFNLSLGTDDSTAGGFRSFVNMTQMYTYYKTYDIAYKGYLRINSNDSLTQAARFAAKPVFLGESNYEGADNAGGNAHPATPYVLRCQEYWTVLGGGLFGQIWGNKIVHHFSSGWQSNLNTTGAQDATRWAAFFRSVAWYNLVPDINNTFVTGGFGTYDGGLNLITAGPGTYATAASTPDGSLGLCYTPVNQGLVVAMTTMRGTTTARWFDPTNGTYTPIGSFPNTGSHTFTPSATNSAGDPDWVLVLTA